MFCLKPYKKAAPNFILKTIHCCMTEHVNIGILQSSMCQICNSGIINAGRLLICPEQSLRNVVR